MPALPGDETERMVADALGVGASNGGTTTGRESIADIARLVQALSEGRPGYTRAIVESMASRAGHGVADPVAALTALLEPDTRLSSQCAFSYELRLHRARGYGALKGILEILSEQEPLTLTEISKRLGRTPGSTKDYLSWLEDVDLVLAHQKRYRFRDPLLRVWARLHCQPTPPAAEKIGREVQRYAATCLPATLEHV